MSGRGRSQSNRSPQTHSCQLSIIIGAWRVFLRGRGPTGYCIPQGGLWGRRRAPITTKEGGGSINFPSRTVQTSLGVYLHYRSTFTYRDPIHKDRGGDLCGLQGSDDSDDSSTSDRNLGQLPHKMNRGVARLRGSTTGSTQHSHLARWGHWRRPSDHSYRQRIKCTHILYPTVKVFSSQSTFVRCAATVAQHRFAQHT